MEDRLAQVRALVDERWSAVRATHRENRLRELRVSAFERCLHSDLLAKNAAAATEIAALEKEVAVEATEEAKCRLELVMREHRCAKVQASVWAKQRQIDLLKDTLKEQRASVDAVWTEMLEDRELLREQDRVQAEKAQQAQCEEERIAQDLQSQLAELESAIAAKKIDTDNTKSAVEKLKHRKRSLEGELQAANAANSTLKANIARIRGPNYAAVVEQGVDAILRELDEMGAR